MLRKACSILDNRYQQQLNNIHMKKDGNLYPNNLNMLENMNMNNTGFMRLNIVKQSDKTPVNNATITIYVTDGMQRDIPVMHLITTINPIRIELPMANELGTKITGPEYNFSTYNLRVDAFGYIARNIYNIRLFPNITTNYEIGMQTVTDLDVQPLIEERLDFPPHPRDTIEGIPSTSSTWTFSSIKNQMTR